MRGGAVLGSSGKVTGLAVRFLARDMRLTGARGRGYTLLRHTIDPLSWGIPGYQWQIVQTRLKVDARLDLPALMCAALTIRLSLTASAPHSNPVHAGRNPTDWSGSRRPALLRHVQAMFNE